jgi:hypothetical protein
MILEWKAAKLHLKLKEAIIHDQEKVHFLASLILRTGLTAL